MQVKAIDHINIITADLDTSARFYAALLQLERRNAPPPLTPENAQWMCDTAGNPLIHLNTPVAPKAIERDTSPGPRTGALHHVALRCTGHADAIAGIGALGLQHHLNEIPFIGLRQIFVSYPNGVLLELNFFGE